MRQLAGQQRTAISNQIRGLLAEHGLVLRPGLPQLRRRLLELLEDAGNGLDPEMRDLTSRPSMPTAIAFDCSGSRSASPR